MKPKPFLLLAFTLITRLLYAQLPDSLDAAKWAKTLSNKNDKENKAFNKLGSVLNVTDSSTVYDPGKRF
ncbi:MAG TPA: hypothetical protein VFW07_23965 [Parafilimonas sp.]|nr:hypothetical protein [Parafilimonas sp.]